MLQYKKFLASFLCAIILFFCINQHITARNVQNLEWIAQVGDSQTYIYNQYYNSELENPHQSSFEMTTTDDSQFTIVLKKGLIVRYEITFLGSFHARGTITYNGSVTSNVTTISRIDMVDWSGVVRPTINNESYWDEWCKYRSQFNVTNNYVIQEVFIRNATDSPGYHFIHKWDWKTGWMSFYYDKSWNETAYREIEIALVSSEKPSSNQIIFGVIFLGVIITLLITITLYRRNK